MGRALLLACALGLLLPAAPAGAGALKGRVSLAVEGTRLADLGPTVVFLEGGNGAAAAPARGARPEIHQRNARFDPDFLVVSAGQSVDMPNDDTIFHNVFSFSRPNDFDLGIYPAGDARTVTFEHAGLVRLYCSIHESMTGAVLVTPSPWFATASASGDYRIAGVPAGRYRLTVWNQKLPPATREVRVDTAGTERADVVLGGVAP
jgi:plastocyanin